MSSTRRLAAILAADVAHYARLMGVDEEGTLERVKAMSAEVIEPSIAAHGGRIFKSMGDGFLAEFASVVEAVRCSLAIQRGLTERNSRNPAEMRLRYRIGIHVGDVIIDGGDIYGDGVNIAARLETLARPDGICVSARVFEDVSGRIDVEFQDGSEQALKNIARSVRVYHVRLKEQDPESPDSDGEGESVQRRLVTGALRNIGYLGVAPRPVNEEFRRALAAYGHIYGQTIRMHYRWSEGDYSRYPELVRELIDLSVEVIVASATPAVVAARQATRTIPIVMVEVGDPVAYGIVESLTRPDGNVTGMSNGLHEYGPRSLRLFKEIAPHSVRAAVLAPGTPTHHAGAAVGVKSIEEVAHALDMIPRAYYASTPDELRVVLAGLDQRTDVLFVIPDHGLSVYRTITIAAAAARKIPVICPLPEYVPDGALLSLGPNRTELFRRAAYYVDAILKGTPSNALPIEEPSKHLLLFNLRTARTLGITIPGPILVRADELIE